MTHVAGIILAGLATYHSNVFSEDLRQRVKLQGAENILVDIGLDDEAFDYFWSRFTEEQQKAEWRQVYKKDNYKPAIIEALKNISVVGGVPGVELDDYFPVYLYTAQETDDPKKEHTYDKTHKKVGMPGLFWILNAELRTDSEATGHMGSLPNGHALYKYWQKLTRAVEKFPTHDKTVYRGACLKKEYGSLTDWKQKVGQKMTTPSFCSLSRELSISKGYIMASKKYGESGESTSRILKINLAESTLKGYCIGKASMFRKEREVLALPGHALTILSRTKREGESPGHEDWRVQRRL